MSQESKQAYQWATDAVEQTQEIAHQLAQHVQPGDVIALEGDLGAGKTSFTQGFAKGLGVQGVVNSPTFTIIKEYQGRMPLYHMDVYRVGEEIEDLGYDEYFYGDGVTLIEWASMIERLLPDNMLKIEITKGEGDQRNIRMIPLGKRFETLCKELE